VVIAVPVWHMPKFEDLDAGILRLIEVIQDFGAEAVIKPCIHHPYHDDRWKFVPAERVIVRNTDALVIWNIYDFDYLNSFRGLDAPAVVCDADTNALGLDSVFFDNFSSSAALTRHLISKGNTHIAFAGGPLKNISKRRYIPFDPCTVERVDGYLFAMQEAGLEPKVIHAPLQRFGEDLDKELIKLFTAQPEITAVVSECRRDMKGLAGRPVEYAFWRQPLEKDEAWPEGASAIAFCDHSRVAEAAAEMVRERLLNPDQTVMRQKIEAVIQTRG